MQNFPLIRHAVLIVAACAFLTGCSQTMPIIETRYVKPAIPPSLAMPCNPPVKLPDRTLSAGDIVPLWARDRASLKACAARHNALVETTK